LPPPAARRTLYFPSFLSFLGGGDLFVGFLLGGALLLGGGLEDADLPVTQIPLNSRDFPLYYITLILDPVSGLGQLKVNLCPLLNLAFMATLPHN